MMLFTNPGANVTINDDIIFLQRDDGTFVEIMVDKETGKSHILKRLETGISDDPPHNITPKSPHSKKAALEAQLSAQ